MAIKLVKSSHKMDGEINTGYADFITELLILST